MIENNRDIEYYKNPSLYVDSIENDPWMQIAKESALKHSKTPIFPIGIVAVKDGRVVATSANGNGYHEQNNNTPEHKKGCKRRYISEQREMKGQEKLASGEGFELCPGCDIDYHAEARLIRESKNSEDLKGATVYMYGHWWCCGPCWEKMKDAGIMQVHLLSKFKHKENLVKWRDEYERLREG